MTTLVVGARIDESLKAKADKVLHAHHVSPGQLLRSVYEYIVKTGEIPEFIYDGTSEATIEDDRPPILAFREKLLQEGLGDIDWSTANVDEASERYAHWMDEKARGLENESGEWL